VPDAPCTLDVFEALEWSFFFAAATMRARTAALASAFDNGLAAGALGLGTATGNGLPPVALFCEAGVVESDFFGTPFGAVVFLTEVRRTGSFGGIFPAVLEVLTAVFA